MPVTKEEMLLAQQSLEMLQTRFKTSRKRRTPRLLVEAEGAAEVVLPPQAVQALTETLRHLAQGTDVAITPQPDEMTTQEAADFLHVSRPFMVQLLESGEIPHRKVGTHRRVLSADLRAYKQRTDDQRLKVLDALAAQAQELGMGY